MSKQRFTPEFKDEAVRQITERGYAVSEVSERLGVSAYSLYKWVGVHECLLIDPSDALHVADVEGCPASPCGWSDGVSL